MVILENMFPREELSKEATRRNSEYEYASVNTVDIPMHQTNGWEVANKIGKYKTKVRRCKPKHAYTEDWAWMALYRMGFPYLCGAGGAILRQSATVYNQLDGCAFDDEAAVVVECKSADEIKTKDSFTAELNTLEVHRLRVAEVLKGIDGQSKRRVGAIMVLHDYVITDTQRERAKASRVTILDAVGLRYYSDLAEHIGEAARYQLFSEVFSNQKIEGLQLTVPAVQAKLGDRTVYTFVITPEHLLKIAFVAHRSRGDYGAAGYDAYQRMVKKSRLSNIRAYIDNGGVFPTNIVITFNPEKEGSSSGLRFDKTVQVDDATDEVRLGWLHLPARYQSAWIIDGQHRLLAYSGHEKAGKSFLSVTAYDGLDVAEQLRLFTTINSEQKKVPGNLLVELYSSLKWHSTNDKEQTLSIISRAIQQINITPESPFYKRILLSDDNTSELKCISLKSLSDALYRSKLFISEEKNGKTLKYGTLWQNKPEDTLKRTCSVLNAWFNSIAEVACDNWALGKSEGGYLATNNGVVACIYMLRSVLDFLDRTGPESLTSSTKDLIDRIAPYGDLIGMYFATRTESELRQIRRRLGDSGQREVSNMALWEIRKQQPNFAPTGLIEWIERQADEKRDEAIKVLHSIEHRTRIYVVNVMQDTFGDKHEDWWPEVPEQVRKDVVVQRELDNRSRGLEANYLTYDNLRKVALDHWSDLFREKLGFGQGNKMQRTQWFETFDKLQKRLQKEGSSPLQKEEYNLVAEVNNWLEDHGI